MDSLYTRRLECVKFTRQSITAAQMEPLDFMTQYPGTTQADLARLTGYREDYARHWFCGGKTARRASKQVRIILGLIHALRVQQSNYVRLKNHYANELEAGVR